MARPRRLFVLLVLATVITACSASRELAAPSSPRAAAAPKATTTAAPPLRETESALRKQLASLATRGEPDYDQMVPSLAEVVRGYPSVRQGAARLGAVRSVAFIEGAQGVDVYDVTNENGLARWRIALAPDGKVAMLRFQVRKKPAPAGGDAELAAAIDARIASEGDAFSGAVLVARGGVPIYQKAVGLADREHGRANTVGTRFRIASMGKMFTAVAVLQLVQAGKVRLDAPLGAYLKGYPNQEVARKVTIHQLLTHTGGTGQIPWPAIAARGEQVNSLQDYVELYGTRDPSFEPGSRFQYSNYGFVLLGRVIELASGQSYYDYVEQHVFAPAGMTHSDFAPAGDLNEERAIGYTHGRPERAPDAPQGAGSVLYPNTSLLPYRSTSAGGAYSTLADLLAFANALESHRLLDAKHTDLLTTGKVATPDGEQYAYGFSDATLPGLRCIGHNGGSPGTSARLRICRASGDATVHLVAVLANLDPPAGTELMRFIRSTFAHEPTVTSNEPTGAATRELERK